MRFALRTCLVLSLCAVAWACSDDAALPEFHVEGPTGGLHLGEAGAGAATGGDAGLGGAQDCGESPCSPEAVSPCADVVCPYENQECVVQGNAPRCQCSAGYDGDECADIDECARGAHACDEHATCTNLPGSYSCACNDGFHGDGVSCTDVTECANQIHGCDPLHGTCEEAEGGYSCSCNEGFGNGYFCNSVDHCEPSPCQNGGICRAVRDGFVCECPLGTSGATCSDTESCSVLKFADPVLDALVRKLAGQAEGTLVPEDLEWVTTLSVPPNAGVASLVGLECWTTLQTLHLAGNDVQDLTPLAHLHHLQELDVSCNRVSTLEPLSAVTSLEVLRADRASFCEHGEQLTSLVPLARLDALHVLSLDGQLISDLATLAALARLRTLGLRENPLSCEQADVLELLSARGVDISSACEN